MIAIGNAIGINFGSGGVDWATRTPSELILTIVSDTQNKLDWTINGTGYDGFSIERSDNGNTFFELATVSSITDTFIDKLAEWGLPHFYRIRAYKGTNYSPYSSIVNNLLGDVTTGLVGQWLFNEGSGDTALDTGGANNGTITGAVYAAGKAGAAISFDGVAGNDSIVMGDVLDTTFAGASKTFTISAWIKPGAVMTANAIVAKYYSGVGGQRQFALVLTTGSKLRFLWYGALDGSTVRGYTGTITPITNTNKWYHILITYDGTVGLYDRVKLYIDFKEESYAIDVSTGTPSEIVDGTAQLCIGAYKFGDGSTTNNFNGLIDSVNIFNRVLTITDIITLSSGEVSPNESIPEAYENTAILYGYEAGTRKDYFLDHKSVESYNDCQLVTNKPTRYVNNPVFITGVNGDTWDYEKSYNTVLKIGGTYYMWYGAVSNDDPVEYYICYATSADGLTWVKPDLDLVSYGGDTNNNIILGNGAVNPAVVYDADGAADRKYVMTVENKPGALIQKSIFIYISADGINFTLLKTLTPAGDPYIECKEIIKRPDWRWYAYYTWYNLVDSRRIGVWLSNTSLLSGTWVDWGTVINTTVATDQKYNIGVEYSNGFYYGFVMNYNSTSLQMVADLYISRDGIHWSKRSSEWLPLGASGQFDDEMITSIKTMVQEGNNWRLYYTGFPENHVSSAPRDVRIGIALIPYQRIGGLKGTGTYITKAFTPTAILTVNTDLTHGTLQVELLLASDDSVIAGYSKDDMDALSGDTYSTEVTWGGNSIPTDTELKIKFYLS